MLQRIGFSTLCVLLATASFAVAQPDATADWTYEYPDIAADFERAGENAGRASLGAIPGIKRSAPITTTGAPFYTGATEIVPAGAVLGMNERFAVLDFVSNPSPAHDIHLFDEDLNQVGTIQVVLIGSHCTGLAWDTASQTFWVSDFLAFPSPAIREFDISGFATGNSFAFCDTFPASGITIDNSFGRRILYAYEGGTDTIRAWDLDADAEVTEFPGAGCSGTCTRIPNPDGTDSEGFGLSTAADPGRCAGGSLVLAGGADSITTLAQVGYASDPLTCPTPVSSCFNCDLFTPLAAAGEFVPQGIVEFLDSTTGDRDLFVVGAGTNSVYVLDCAIGIGDCQNIDAEAATLYVNGVQGGSDFAVEVTDGLPIAASIQKPGGAGNGKFVMHLDAGAPNASTVTSLVDLGDSCFPFIAPTSDAVWNNVGKTGQVGASMYFGTMIDDPERADTFFLLLPSGDAANLPIGSTWTLQGVILNPSSSSTRGASLTNAIRIDVQ